MLLTTDAGTSKQHFAKNNSCCDQKVTPRIVIVEQNPKRDTGLYTLFTDFEKALDSIDHNMLWKIFEILSSSGETNLMICMRTIRGKMMEPFNINMQDLRGVLASCSSLPCGAHWVAKQGLSNNKTRIKFTLLQKLRDLNCTDDLVLLS